MSARRPAAGNRDADAAYARKERRYDRSAAGKPPIPGSSDPAFRGDRARYNPEELLVAALSACHMLAYLHLCAVNGVTVVDYRDAAYGVMEEREDGSGRFVSVLLRPHVTISAGHDQTKALELHHDAHRACFIASSVNFPVEVAPEIVHAAAS